MLYLKSSELIHLLLKICTLYQLFPPSPPPSLTTTFQPLFYSLFWWVLLFYFCLFFNILHISDTVQYYLSSVWLISFVIMPIWYFHVIANGWISSLLRSNNIQFYIYFLVPHFIDPFICWWTQSLFPYLDYC